MKITYTFVTGETVEIEVDEEMGAAIVEFDRQDSLRDRAETRRHNSMDELADAGFQLADPAGNIADMLEERETDLEWQERLTRLKAAVQDLQPQQQVLVEQVFFKRRPIVDVANELGITRQACNNRLNKIYQRLKKYF